MFKFLSVISNISIKNIFRFEKYIGSRNELKLLHNFKGKLKLLIFPKRVPIEGLKSLPGKSSSSNMSKTSPDEY